MLFNDYSFRRPALVAALAGLGLGSCQPARQPVDLLVVNAHVQTVDSLGTEAEALAVRDGRFVAVGRTAELRARYQPTQEVDAKGQFIYPGLHDAHCHYYYYALGLREAKLGAARSWPEAVRLLQEQRRRYPQVAWLTGSGWDQTKWPGQRYPGSDTLSILFPDVPVLLWRVDGHAVLTNAKAREAAGFTPAEAARLARNGGAVGRTAGGALTGLLLDNAASFVAKAQPEPGPAEAAALLREAEQQCLTLGLTSLTEAGLSRGQIERLDSLQRRGQLKLRLHALALASDAPTRRYYLGHPPLRGARLSVPGFKVFVDGALGSRGACLRQPYSDQPGHLGQLRLAPDSLRALARAVAASRLQLCAHAIGDSANHLVLQAFGQALGGQTNRRWRVEHAQVVTAADRPLFTRYGIIPSVQPAHATSDKAWTGQRLGPARLPLAYAYAALHRANPHLPLGSDFPVEPLNPLFGYHAAVTRQDAQGQPAGGFLPEGKLSRLAALRGMTTEAAYAVFQEKNTGRIAPGLLADFILLDTDLLKAPGERLRGAQVKQTWIEGKRVF